MRQLVVACLLTTGVTELHINDSALLVRFRESRTKSKLVEVSLKYSLFRIFRYVCVLMCNSKVFFEDCDNNSQEKTKSQVHFIAMASEMLM